MNYKIKNDGIGLDMTHLNYCPKVEYLKDFNYIHTSIRSNNDHVISEVFEDFAGKTLVTEIGFTDKISVGLLSHLVSIGREWIDILEIPATCTWNDKTYEQLKYLTDAGMIYDISVKNPEKPEELEEIINTLDLHELKLRYVSLDLCPLNFNYDIINYCKDKEIEIIGYNSMGGKLTSESVIDCFTVPYLLGFAATHCHIVMLSGRDLFKSMQGAKYLENLIGKESEPMFTLRKNVRKLHKPLKKVINTSIVFEGDIQLPYNSPDYIPVGEESIVIGLNKTFFEMPERELNETEKVIYGLIRQLDFPEDATPEDKFSISKSQVIAFLKTKYSEHLFMYSMINDTTIAVKAIKHTEEGWFKKTIKTDTQQYLMSMMPDGTMFFKEINE